MSSLGDRIYANSPLWVQQLGINAFGWYWARRRLGGDFEKIAQGYREREKWTSERFRKYVTEQLRQQLLWAYRNVSHYRETFREHGITEQLFEQFEIEDLPRLPLMEKSVLRERPLSLLADNSVQKPPAVFLSSGTTGTPIRIYWDRSVHRQNIAVRAVRSFEWAGVSYRDSRAMVGGRTIVSPANPRPPFWRYNRWEKQLYMSALHLRADNVCGYVEALNRFRPATLTGYASALYFLAKNIDQAGLTVHQPRAIITTSDALHPHMRQLIERVFRASVREEYGAVENAVLATECDHGRLHVHSDFGILEILRADGSPAAPGETGEMVQTGLANTNQLFIRYRIGDLAAWAVKPCPCGRNLFPSLDCIVGRIEDTIVLPDGRETRRMDFLFKDLPGLIEGQIVQEAVDHLVFNLATTNDFSEEQAMKLLRDRLFARYSLGTEMKIQIRRVPEVPKERNGKFRAIISKVRPKRPGQAAEA
jgi:phenylacetate-CoA ligase